MSNEDPNAVSQAYEDIDLDEHLSADYTENEYDEMEDPVLASLTPEEKALLAKIEKKQREQDHIIQTFNDLAEKPSEERIEHFKQQAGDVYLGSFSDHENFIFRPIKRLEWRNLTQKIQKLDPLKQSEAIVMKACLWPEMNQHNINVLTAGAVETLKELILQASNFMAPEVAMQLVRKL